MNETEEDICTRRRHRLLQWSGLFLILHTIWSSWYVPEISLFLTPCTVLLFLLIMLSHVCVGLIGCDGILTFIGGLVTASAGYIGYLTLATYFSLILTAVTGMGNTHAHSFEIWHLVGFLACVLAGLVPIPRRGATAMLALSIFLPFSADAADACMSMRVADPTPLNYAAYALFLAGSVRLYTYAAGRFWQEGLGEALEPARERVKIRRAVGPIMDVAPIRSPRSGAFRAAPVPAVPRRTRTARTPAARVPLNIANAHCPVCAAGFDSAAARIASRVVTCSTCATPHHAECFAFSAGCAMYACGSDAAVTLA